MVFSLVLSLLAEEIIVAALTEKAVKAFMRFIARNDISAPLALHELIFPAFFTNKVVACFVVNSFSGRYFFSANFTFYCIHTYASLRARCQFQMVSMRMERQAFLSMS